MLSWYQIRFSLPFPLHLPCVRRLPAVPPFSSCASALAVLRPSPPRATPRRAAPRAQALIRAPPWLPLRPPPKAPKTPPSPTRSSRSRRPTPPPPPSAWNANATARPRATLPWLAPSKPSGRLQSLPRSGTRRPNAPARLSRVLPWSGQPPTPPLRPNLREEPLSRWRNPCAN